MIAPTLNDLDPMSIVRLGRPFTIYRAATSTGAAWTYANVSASSGYKLRLISALWGIHAAAGAREVAWINADAPYPTTILWTNAAWPANTRAYFPRSETPFQIITPLSVPTSITNRRFRFGINALGAGEVVSLYGIGVELDIRVPV